MEEMKKGEGEDYFNAIKGHLVDAGFTPDDIMCFASDHDGFVQKGMRMFDRPLLGCACHALQLPVKHIMPALRSQKLSLIHI